MTLAEARRVIWQRLAITAREDGHNNDWDDYDELDVKRLQRASEQVSEMIERRLRRPR